MPALASRPLRGDGEKKTLFAFTASLYRLTVLIQLKASSRNTNQNLRSKINQIRRGARPKIEKYKKFLSPFLISTYGNHKSRIDHFFDSNVQVRPIIEGCLLRPRPKTGLIKFNRAVRHLIDK